MIGFKKVTIKRLLKKLKSMQLQRAHSQPNNDAIQKEIALYHRLATLYRSLLGNTKTPFARVTVLECYRAAAELEDAEAQYLLGKGLLNEAKYRESLQTEGTLASQSNELKMKRLYEESLAYLQASVKLNHIQAKRLLGLCYIQGIGVPADSNKGFDYVVSSIEQEQSWDKVPQIFAEMGLNKPEYFSALMSKRK